MCCFCGAEAKPDDTVGENMENLRIYEAVRSVPGEALKPIEAGRLKGKSDINPMWRIKKLTEIYGPCGIGWKYIITRQWTEPGANEEIAAFTDIDLFVKEDEKWSEAIPGTGGSMFVAKERNGLYTSDECFKMSLTDAISVSCKALGIGADVYWNGDSTKYTTSGTSRPEKYQESNREEHPKNEDGFWAQVENMGFTKENVIERYPIAKNENMSKAVREGILNNLRRQQSA